MDRISKTNRFDPELWKELKKLTAETRITTSKLLDEAIEDLLHKYHPFRKRVK